MFVAASRQVSRVNPHYVRTPHCLDLFGHDVLSSLRLRRAANQSRLFSITCANAEESTAGGQDESADGSVVIIRAHRRGPAKKNFEERAPVLAASQEEGRESSKEILEDLRHSLRLAHPAEEPNATVDSTTQPARASRKHKLKPRQRKRTTKWKAVEGGNSIEATDTQTDSAPATVTSPEGSDKQTGLALDAAGKKTEASTTASKKSQGAKKRAAKAKNSIEATGTQTETTPAAVTSPEESDKRTDLAPVADGKKTTASTTASKKAKGVKALSSLIQLIRDGELSAADLASAKKQLRDSMVIRDQSGKSPQAQKTLNNVAAQSLLADLHPTSARNNLVRLLLSDSKSTRQTLGLDSNKEASSVPQATPRPRGSPAKASSPDVIQHAASDHSRAAKRPLTFRTGSSGPGKQALARRIPVKAVRTIKPSAPIKIRSGPLVAKPGFKIESVEADSLTLTPLSIEQPPVPGLAYGLERALFNPGVYQLQDPRSRVFNFDPYLQKITPVEDFDFAALKEYKTSSKDTVLIDHAKSENKKYTGSTSSMTSVLAHFHFLISQWRTITTDMLSQSFPVEFGSFTSLQRCPQAVFLRWRDGAYAIDADKQWDTPNVLSMLGKSMEKLLTLPREEYETYLKTNSHKISQEERNEPESFHYTTMGDFLMRSQLDAYDPRVPGTGMFDLKTRAVISIRMDTSKFKEGSGYEIRGRHGQFESYEREYYDMIRAAFLKYSLQVRMGRMDGIFVAFHNTERIFGFQYISLSEMDYALHGTTNTSLGDQEFKLSLDLMNKALDRATQKWPEQSLQLHFETRGGATDTPFMYIFAEPISEEKIEKIQNTNKAYTEEFERKILRIQRPNDLKKEKAAEWDALRAKVEEAVEKDELSMQNARELAVDLLEENEILDLSPEEAEARVEELISALAQSIDEEKADEEDELADNEAEEAEEVDEAEILSEEIAEGDAEASEEFDLSRTGRSEEDAFVNDTAEIIEDESSLSDESAPVDEIQEVETLVQSEEAEEFDTDEPVDAIGDEDISASAQGDVQHAESEMPLSEETSTEETSAEEASTEELSTKEEPFIVQTSTDESSAEASSLETTDTSEAADAKTPSDTSKLDNALSSLSSLANATPAQSEVLGMTLTIRNKVNDAYEVRPDNLTEDDKWTVEYALRDLDTSKAALLLQALKVRRRTTLAKLALVEDESLDVPPRPTTQTGKKPANTLFLKELSKLSKGGRTWRKAQDEEDAKSGIKRL